MDSLGNLYISDSNNNRLVYATTQGQCLGEIDGITPACLILDTAADLFVADLGGCVMDEYLLNPNYVTPTTTPTATNTPNSPWSLTGTLQPHCCPQGVAVEAGYIATSDGYSHVDHVFDSNGKWLYDIATSAAPFGLTIDSNGELYSAEYGTGVVGYMLGANGAVSEYTWTGRVNFNNVMDVKIDAHGNLVVADMAGGRIWNVSKSDDSVLYVTPHAGFTPWGVALDAAGNIYAACHNNGLGTSGIIEFSALYQYTNYFSGSNWTTPLGGGYGVAVDSLENLYISDPSNGRVVYATAQGGYLGEIDGFSNPEYLALDSVGHLFVADWTSNCVVDEYTNNMAIPPTATETPVFSYTPTAVLTSTLSPTFTMTPQFSYTPTFTATDTPTVTLTLTLRQHDTPTVTYTPRPHTTLQATPTPIPSGAWNLTAALTPEAGDQCPYGVATGAGYVAVSDGNNNGNVSVFDNNGSWLYDISTSGGWLGGLAIDYDGELYVAEGGTGVVGYFLGPGECCL